MFLLSAPPVACSCSIIVIIKLCVCACQAHNVCVDRVIILTTFNWPNFCLTCSENIAASIQRQLQATPCRTGPSPPWHPGWLITNSNDSLTWSGKLPWHPPGPSESGAAKLNPLSSSPQLSDSLTKTHTPTHTLAPAPAASVTSPFFTLRQRKREWGLLGPQAPGDRSGRGTWRRINVLKT